MAILCVQNGSGDHAWGTSVGKAFAGATTAGNRIIAIVASDNGDDGLGTVADDKNGAYNCDYSKRSGGNAWVGIFSVVVADADTTTVTYSWSGNHEGRIAIAEFSGIHATPLDNESSATAYGTAPAPGSITPSVDNCLVIAGEGNTDAVGTSPAGYTSIYKYSAGMSIEGTYLIQTTKAATNPTWAITESWWAAASQAYKPADTSSAPTVTTTAITAIAPTTATSGGNVTDDGGDAVTDRGVCWSTSANPTTADSHTHDSSGEGAYASSLTSLSPDTLYHVRAWATNSIGTSYGADVEFTTGEDVNAALTGVSGTASVGAVALSAALALTGLVGTGAVGTLGPDVTVPISGVEAPASVGTMSPDMAAIAAGIAALGETGTVGQSVTVSMTGSAATGAVEAGIPTTPISGVSSGMTYPLSGVEATGEVGTMTPEIGVSPDITIPITGVSSGIAYQLSGEEATGGVGTVTAVSTYDDIALPITGVVGTGAVGSITYFEGPGGEAMTGDVGDVAPTVAPPLTGNEATAAVDSVGQDRTAGLGGVAGTGAAGGWNTIARAITGTGGTGAVGTLTPTRSKAITGNAATTARGSLVQSHDITPTGISVTGVAGYLDTFSPGSLSRPLTGVYATGRAGTTTCGTAVPNYVHVKPRKRILTVAPRRRIITVSRRRF